MTQILYLIKSKMLKSRKVFCTNTKKLNDIILSPTDDFWDKVIP